MTTTTNATNATNATTTTEPAITVPAPWLRAVLRAVQAPLPKKTDPSRPQLAQVRIKLRNRDLVAVTTDGHRLHLVEAEWRVAPPEGVMLAARASTEWGWSCESVHALLKVLGGRLEAGLTATLGPAGVMLSDGRVIPMIPGTAGYPDYKQVVPAYTPSYEEEARPSEITRLNAKYMAEALEAAHALDAGEVDVQPGSTGLDPMLLRAVGGLDGPCPGAVLTAVVMPMRR
jgi:hypothetical protein